MFLFGLLGKNVMIGKELKGARKTLGLSQQSIADLIGTTRRTWQDWEYDVTPCPGPVASLIFLLLRYKGAVAALLARET